MATPTHFNLLPSECLFLSHKWSVTKEPTLAKLCHVLFSHSVSTWHVVDLFPIPLIGISIGLVNNNTLPCLFFQMSIVLLSLGC